MRSFQYAIEPRRGPNGKPESLSGTFWTNAKWSAPNRHLTPCWCCPNYQHTCVHFVYQESCLISRGCCAAENRIDTVMFKIRHAHSSTVSQDQTLFPAIQDSRCSQSCAVSESRQTACGCKSNPRKLPCFQVFCPRRRTLVMLWLFRATSAT